MSFNTTVGANIHKSDIAPEEKATLIGDLLDQVARLCLDMDTEDLRGTIGSCKVRYPEQTLLDATIVLSSVMANGAIHSGCISNENKAELAGEALHKVLLDYYGFDTYRAEQILEKQ